MVVVLLGLSETIPASKADFFQLGRVEVPSVAVVQAEFETGETSQVYQRYVQMTQDWPVDKQHALGHAIGEALYTKHGQDGITYCSSDFSFGCFHSLFLEAVAAGGTQVALELGQSCVERFGPPPSSLGCDHGVGHGLGELLGPNRLMEQLAVCDQLEWDGPYLGCAGGVFMEFNQPILISPDSIKTGLREFNPEDPFYPCNEVSGRYQPECYVQQADWWYAVLDQDVLAVKELCNQVSDPNLERDCFRGLGLGMFPRLGFDTQETTQACLELPQSEAVSCLAGLAWALYAMPEHGSQAAAVCNTIPAEKERCLIEMDFLHQFGFSSNAN